MNGIVRVDRRRVLLAAAMVVSLPAKAAAAAAPAIKVYKDPYCGCCTAWAERLKSAGFKVEIDVREEMDEIKEKLGVPADLASCHTAVIGGYTIEGHVPPADIKRLVASRARGKGLAVPGMPVNSPGMEVAGAANERYTVWLFHEDGRRTAFAQHGG